jgi:hypothetical protein
MGKHVHDIGKWKECFDFVCEQVRPKSLTNFSENSISDLARIIISIQEFAVANSVNEVLHHFETQIKPQ